MSIPSALASFAVVAGLLTLVPGLDTALVLRSTAGHGRSHGFATALGINTGALLWGAAAACGATAVLTVSQDAYLALRLGGAAYLLWLGFGLLRSLRRGRPGDDAPVETRPVGLRTSYRRGLTTNLLNPKIGVFYTAMLPQFIPAHAPHLAMGLLLALVHDVEGLSWFALLICAADRLRGLLRRLDINRTTARRALDATTGAVLIAFGLELALADH